MESAKSRDGRIYERRFLLERVEMIWNAKLNLRRQVDEKLMTILALAANRCGRGRIC